MEQHTCKLCNKSFLTGKVLGGHMRSHGAKKTAKTEKKKKLAVSHVDFEGDDDERAGYGLRVNPKKSWKFSGSKVGEEEAQVEEKGCSCEVCGKMFDKMKSLFGHMRHHSGRERKETQCCKVCGRGFESLRALAAHGRSHAKRRRASDEDESEAAFSSEKKLFGDCETMGLVRRKRSKRLRYKINSSCSSFSSLNESKYVTEFGQEIVDGAICLMIISNGGTNWGRISSVTESSDYNEVQSPGQKNLIMGNDNEKKMIEFEENDSGFVGDEENIVKLQVEVPIQKFYDTEVPEFVRCKTEIEMDVNIVEEVELEGPELGSLRSGLSKKSRIKACDSGKNMISGGESEINADALKKRERKCRTCNKVFSSYQALGGHQRVHKAVTNNPYVVKIEESEDKIKGENFSKIDKIEFSDDSVEDDEIGRENVTGCESKGHICSICLKVFATGQALGGHKRVHFGKESEAGIEDTRVMKQQISDICQAFGLGQQVKLEDENGDAEVELIKSCWPGNEHKQELLVGLIPN